MNRRHVRAVAVFAIVLVTLTGARRSGGGGCDDNDSGSSTTSTSGGFTSGGTSTTTSGGSTSSPGTYSPDAMSDVRVTTCDYDQAGRQLKAGLSITNPSATDSFAYSVTVTFETSGTGAILGTDFVSTTVTGGQTTTVDATSLYTNTSTESTNFQCKVTTATKFRSS